MRLCALFLFATASALLFGACGPRFASEGSSSDAGANSSGASGRDSHAGGSSLAGGADATAGESNGGDVGVGGSLSGGAGAPQAGSTGAGCSVAATDCPVPASTCVVAVCGALTHSCGTVKSSLGTACKEKGGVVCNGKGACVASHCMDGVRDADETDVDCGASCGATCTHAPQQRCKVASDCVSGDCAGTPLRCQPPPTCASTCTGSCQSCAIPGQVGSCAKLPSGVDDPANFCFMMAVCDDTGACIGAQNKGHFGDACTENGGCFNETCSAGFCKLRNGDACAEDDACKSARCAGNVCAACIGDGDCAGGKCNAGACLLPGGYPCALAGDCASGQCFGKLCTGGDPCTVVGCPTHFCHNGTTCQTCSSSSDCPLGSACTGGSCLLPPGAFCNKNASCASGTCAAAALLSMRKCE